MFRNRAVREWMVLFAFCAFLFFFGLSYFGLVGADEPRYAQIAREMLMRHDWVTPVLGGVPWLEKPVLYYWQAMIAYQFFGVSDMAARLPSAFDATLMVVAVFLFFRKFRPGFQLDGALMVAASAAVIGFARAASTDMPLAAMFAIAMLAWYAWHETSNKLWLALFYVFSGLGMLAKGPVAVFLAAVIITSFALLRKDWRMIARTLWVPGILLFCLVSLPWYVLVQMRNPEFLKVFILQHNLERFGSNLYHHHQPFWFYLPVALLGFLPWTAFAVDALIVNIRAWWNERKNLQKEDVFGLFLLVWLIVPIVFFSISQSKLPGYILPALPAGLLLIADYLSRNADQRFKKPVIIVHALLCSALIVPAILISAIITQHHLPLGRATAILIAIAIGFAGLSILFLNKYGLRALRFATLAPLLIAIAAILKIGAPSLDDALSARPIAQQLTGKMDLPVAVLKTRREVEYGLHFYLNRNIPRYESNQIPEGEHLVVAVEGMASDISRLDAGRRVIYLGTFPTQHLDFYWISAK